MSAELNRRKALGVCAAGVASIIGPAKSQNRAHSEKDGDITHCFINQSGDFEKGEFAVGMILTKHPTELLNNISSIRKDTRYSRELVPKSTDKFKLEYCKSLISMLLNQREIKFGCCRVSLEDMPEAPIARDRLLVKAHRPLFMQHKGSLQGTIKMHFVENFSIRTKVLAEALRHEALTSEKSVFHARSANDILQFTGLLTNISATDAANVTNVNRIKLYEYLINTLGITKIKSGELVTHPIFRVRSINI